MARTALATQPVADEGTVIAMTAANVDGHVIDGGGDVILKVTNGGGGSINVTVQTAATQNGLAVAEQVVAVAAGATKYIGRFDPSTYDRPSGAADPGDVYVDFSGVTTVTVAAIGV
jgi:hypothetical protein